MNNINFALLVGILALSAAGISHRTQYATDTAWAPAIGPSIAASEPVEAPPPKVNPANHPAAPETKTPIVPPTPAVIRLAIN